MVPINKIKSKKRLKLILFIIVKSNHVKLQHSEMAATEYHSLLYFLNYRFFLDIPRHKPLQTMFNLKIFIALMKESKKYKWYNLNFTFLSFISLKALRKSCSFIAHSCVCNTHFSMCIKITPHFTIKTQNTFLQCFQHQCNI